MNNEPKAGLIIFIRNPVLGKVKSRLAKDIGDEKTLLIYNYLLAHTHKVTCDLNFDRFLFYSDQVNQDDSWQNSLYHKYLQPGGNLGERMSAAFAQLFQQGYHQLVIIGSDCMELTPSIIVDAFQQLNSHDAVIGPAKDGGYYLLGLNRLIPGIFENPQWGTATVLADTLQALNSAAASIFQLEQLADIDEVKDLPESLQQLFL